jgi:hypothetical protein
MKKLNIQVEGTYENEYSLSIVNKAIALAIDQHSSSNIKLYATTYHAQYMDELENIDENLIPFIDKKLDRIDVTIRNIYPPYTTNMQGYHKIIGPYGWEESKIPKTYVEWFNTKLTMLFTMSKYVQDLLKDNGVTIPIVTTGIVVEDILEIKSKEPRFALPSGFRLLHISSCFPRKGAELLLNVFEELSQTKDISLTIKTFPNEHNKLILHLKTLNYQVDKRYEDGVTLYN